MKQLLAILAGLIMASQAIAAGQRTDVCKPTSKTTQYCDKYINGSWLGCYQVRKTKTGQTLVGWAVCSK